MLATYLDRIAALSRPTKLIHDLKHANDPLIETGDWFRNWVTRTGIPTVTFYEISPYKGTFIVDRRSADPSTPGRPAIPLDADHVSIAKFSDRGVAAYQQIVKFIRDAIVARTGPSPTNAPHLRRPSVSPASDSLAELWAAAARSSSDADLVEPALQTLRLNVRITAAKRAGENATELRRSGEAVLSAVRSRLRAVASPPVLGIDVINIVPLTSVDEGATTEDIAVRAFKSASRLGGDGARVIHEAVAELVDNLVEHARGRGYVAVTFDKTTDLVTVIVGDSGVGLLRSMAQRGAMTDREAILFAAEIGSRMADPGRGQGLPHMITTAIIYGGAFSLATGSTQITYSHAGREYRDLPDSVRVNGTLARLILPYAQLLQGRADQVSARRPRPSDAVVEAKLPRFVSSRRQAADLVKALGDLRGATVVLVPDKDEAVAISAGHEVLRALEEAGVAAVRITNPPPWWKQYLSDAATNGRYTMQIVIE
jgi:hypothetical protein